MEEHIMYRNQIVPGDSRTADGRGGRALQVVVPVLRPRRGRRHRRLPPYPAPRRRHLLGVRLSLRRRRLGGEPLSPGPATRYLFNDVGLGSSNGGDERRGRRAAFS